jgi:hypothetical protein
MDRIHDGKAQMQPEDWSFTREARKAGATGIYATRAVKVRHMGIMVNRCDSPPITVN